MLQKWKRALVLLLAVLLLFSSVPLTSSAELVNGSGGHWKKLGYYGSPHWKYSFSDDGKTQWGLQASSPYGEAEKLSFTNGEGDHLAYCMELGSIGTTNNNTLSVNFAQYLHPSTNLSTAEKKTYIELAFFYGYRGVTRYGHTSDEERYATQIMIWMIASGDSSDSGKIRDDSTFNKGSTTLNSHEQGFVDKCTSNVPAANKNNIQDVLNKMKEQMVTHETRPSFMTRDKSLASSKGHELSYNSSTGYYETKLTDTNGVLSYYDFSASGVEFVKSGNTLTIRTKNVILKNSSVTITAQRTGAKYSAPVYLTVGGWPDTGGQQGCASTNGKADPVNAYMTVWTNAVGSIRIIKKAPDGTAQGVKFTVTGPAYPSGTTVTTGADGTFPLWNIQPGTYTVKEIVTEGQICTSPNPQTVTVTAGVTSSVTFENRWQKCMVEISKYDAEFPDARLAGAEFHVVVTKGSWRGEDNMTEVDGSPGLFRHGPTVYGATITITETKAPEGYLLFTKPIVIQLNDDTIQKYGVADTTREDNDWIIKVKLDKDGNLSPSGVEGVPNEPIKGRLKIVKKDASTNTPLSGAGFRIYSVSEGKWMEGYEGYTDAKGELTFDNLPYGEYMIYEFAIPDGYEVDALLSGDNIFYVTENGVTITKEVTNKPIKGNLKIVKKDANTSEPLSGAGFRIFSLPEGKKVAEGYTDAKGELTFENLRYGKYAYKEFEAPEGYVLDETMHMFEITENGVTITEEMTNEAMPGSISIHKIDEQGHTLAGVKFLLEYSTDGGKAWSPVQYRADGTRIAAGSCTSAGLENGVLATDADGNAVFSGLCIATKSGKIKYRVTEVETLPGYQLLTETAYEGELSPDKEVDVSFTVVNAHTYVLPATGGMGYWPLAVIAVVLAGGAGGSAVVLRKKRRKAEK